MNESPSDGFIKTMPLDEWRDALLSLVPQQSLCGDETPDSLRRDVQGTLDVLRQGGATLDEKLVRVERERDALRTALEAIQDIAMDYCHNDISAQIKYDTDGALNRILAITQGGAQ